VIAAIIFDYPVVQGDERHIPHRCGPPWPDPAGMAEKRLRDRSHCRQLA
jgi:hypothetical protein